ncbi:helix-turn-helix transcriptional regulator [Streptomyces viridosporus]|uniref:helix-turn-helix transcriptional regulator n=1 Tax=Streptomyces viridosporus TaxID=67581 RepID=UPI0009C1843C|nr:WYL domain-containing protein [Streptomyces viridosporus]
MRADRLVAALLVLQARGRVTAADLAAELEVSERTARRDLEALAAAGIPVYSQRGRGGGWALVGGARTDLTGLSAQEVRALFLAAGTSSSSPELRSALRKVTRAVPEPMRPDAEAAAKVRVVDGLDWSRSAVAAGGPHHAALEHAVLEGRQIRLGYARPGTPPGERTVHPLGLAAKAGHTYLVAGTDRGLRSFRLDRITSVEITDAPVERPDGFELATAWRSLAGRLEERMLAATVRARAEPGALPLLERLLGGRLRVGGKRDDGWVAVEADGPSIDVLAAQLAGLGARIEVLEPPAARQRLARLAEEFAATYGEFTPTTADG